MVVILRTAARFEQKQSKDEGQDAHFFVSFVCFCKLPPRMAETKFLKCACANCGGRIEFPAHGVGSTIPCPHCNFPTELVLETPVVATAVARRSKKWFIAGAVILAVGAIAITAILVTARRLMDKAREKNEAERRALVTALRTNTPAAKTPAPAPAQKLNNFSITAVTIQKTPGSALTYATGTLKNDTDKQRFGVTVELELLDAEGSKVGAAKDYLNIIEPRAEWKFRALVVAKNVSGARVANVKEQQ
jgi:hypothetical protein